MAIAQGLGRLKSLSSPTNCTLKKDRICISSGHEFGRKQLIRFISRRTQHSRLIKDNALPMTDPNSPRVPQFVLHGIEIASFSLAVFLALLFPILVYLECMGTVLGHWIPVLLSMFIVAIIMALWAFVKFVQIVVFIVLFDIEKIVLKILQVALVASVLLTALVSIPHFDAVRLYVWRDYYEHQLKIGTIAGKDEVEFAVWGDTGFAGTNFFQILVKDASGRILTPEKSWGPEWRDELPSMLAPCEHYQNGWFSRHIFGAFYVVHINC